VPFWAACNLALPKVTCGLFISPVVALSVGTLGFMLANHYDFPPAQMTVALLSVLLVLAWLYHRRVATS
jgi:hypothetical protein